MSDTQKTPLEDLLDSHQAAQYLAKKWGMESYSMDAFRVLRYRLGIEPTWTNEAKTVTLWDPRLLDTIEKPDRTKKRGPRAKKNGDGANGSLPTVMLMAQRVAVA